MNLVMLPMWILSGTFFSYSRFPDVMIPFVKALPLTALNDALRAVMIDGAAVTTLGAPLAIVVAWGAVSFVIALKIFRWRCAQLSGRNSAARRRKKPPSAPFRACWNAPAEWNRSAGSLCRARRSTSSSSRGAPHPSSPPASPPPRPGVRRRPVFVGWVPEILPRLLAGEGGGPEQFLAH